ncbi:MAG: hypothetical protein ABIL07_05885 [candidate division WOR-3 bacterium]
MLDVIDLEGHSYSVKSGEKKWQIFLYGRSRFEKDYTFRGMDGLGELFLKCINSFPELRSVYLKNKTLYKIKLQKPMRKLRRRLSEKRLLAAFIDKSMFNSGEVDFLVIKEGNKFHIFWSRAVVDILTNNYEVENSKARGKNQIDDQKVIFKVGGKTHGEIEIMNNLENQDRVKILCRIIKILNQHTNKIYWMPITQMPPFKFARIEETPDECTKLKKLSDICILSSGNY